MSLDQSERPLAFVDAAALGKNQWWRYVLAFFVFIVLLLLLSIVWMVFEELTFAWIEPAGLTYEAYRALVEKNAEWPDLPLSVSVLNTASVLVLVAIGTPAIAATVHWVHRRPFHTLFGVCRFGWRSAIYSAGAGVVPTVLLMVPFLVFRDDFSVITDWSAWLFFAVAIVVLVPFQVLAEETVFRGYLLQAASRLTRRTWVRVLLPAVPFAMIHFASPEFEAHPLPYGIGYFIYGLYFTWLALKSGGLAVPFGLHLAINLSIFTVASSPPSPYFGPVIFRWHTATPWPDVILVALLLAGHYWLLLRWGVIEKAAGTSSPPRLSDRKLQP